MAEINVLFQDVSKIIQQAQGKVKQNINTAMLQSYWQIGRLIVEHEQQGGQRAKYGKQQLKNLSTLLKTKFSKGFDITNLRNMRRFYIAFPFRETPSLELSWSHYNRLSRVEETEARNWYQQQSIENNWSVRALDRQINKLYYERLLSSQNKVTIKTEAQQKISTQANLQPQDLLRDPYVLDFLNLPSQNLTESNLEGGLLDNLQEFLLELGKGFAFVSRQQLFSAKYMPYLPTVQELKQELEKERINVEVAIEKKIQETHAQYHINI